MRLRMVVHFATRMQSWVFSWIMALQARDFGCYKFYITNIMNFFISHIYREKNSSVDKLANYDFTSHGFSWWDLFPSFILEDFRSPLLLKVLI